MKVICIKCGTIVEDFAAKKVTKHVPEKKVKIGRGCTSTRPAYDQEGYICLDCESEIKET